MTTSKVEALIAISKRIAELENRLNELADEKLLKQEYDRTRVQLDSLNATFRIVQKS